MTDDDKVVRLLPHVRKPITPKMRQTINEAYALHFRVRGLGEKPKLVEVSLIIDGSEIGLSLYDSPDEDKRGWDWVLCSVAEREEK